MINLEVVIIGVCVIIISSLIFMLVQTRNQLKQVKLSINTPASIFQSKFHNLMQEHAFFLIDASRRSLGNNIAAYKASLVALKDNINQIRELLIPLFGTNNTDTLIDLWDSITTIFINYGTAIKNGDLKANAAFDLDIKNYEKKVATFWSTGGGIIPAYSAISYNEMLKLVTQNINYEKAAIDSWRIGNYTDYYNFLTKSYLSVGLYADVLAKSIIRNSGYFS